MPRWPDMERCRCTRGWGREWPGGWGPCRVGLTSLGSACVAHRPLLTPGAASNSGMELQLHSDGGSPPSGVALLSSALCVLGGFSCSVQSRWPWDSGGCVWRLPHSQKTPAYFLSGSGGGRGSRKPASQQSSSCFLQPATSQHPSRASLSSRLGTPLLCPFESLGSLEPLLSFLLHRQTHNYTFQCGSLQHGNLPRLGKAAAFCGHRKA